MHDSLPCSLSKGTIKFVSMIPTKVIPDKRLTSVLVNPLKDLCLSELSDLSFKVVKIWVYLVTGGITKTRKEREELPASSSFGIVLEDYLF